MDKNKATMPPMNAKHPPLGKMSDFYFFTSYRFILILAINEIKTFPHFLIASNLEKIFISLDPISDHPIKAPNL